METYERVKRTNTRTNNTRDFMETNFSCRVRAIKLSRKDIGEYNDFAGLAKLICS